MAEIFHKKLWASTKRRDRKEKAVICLGLPACYTMRTEPPYLCSGTSLYQGNKLPVFTRSNEMRLGVSIKIRRSRIASPIGQSAGMDIV